MKKVVNMISKHKYTIYAPLLGKVRIATILNVVILNVFDP